MQNQHWYPPNTYRIQFSASNGYRYQLVTRNAYFDIFGTIELVGRPTNRQIIYTNNKYTNNIGLYIQIIYNYNIQNY